MLSFVYFRYIYTYVHSTFKSYGTQYGKERQCTLITISSTLNVSIFIFFHCWITVLCWILKIDKEKDLEFSAHHYELMRPLTVKQSSATTLTSKKVSMLVSATLNFCSLNFSTLNVKLGELYINSFCISRKFYIPWSIMSSAADLRCIQVTTENDAISHPTISWMSNSLGGWCGDLWIKH